MIGQAEVLAKDTNHLLVVSFYLINIGMIAVRLDGPQISAGDGLIPYVGSQIGVSLLSLGAMHFFNMVMIAKFGRTVSGWVRINDGRGPEKFSTHA